MKIEDKILIWLDKFEFLTPKKRATIFDTLKSETFFEDFVKNYPKIEEVVTYNQFAIMQQDIKNVGIDKYISELESKNIIPITKNNENYPKSLLQIGDPPEILYCKGDISLLNSENNIAIVGTRRPSNYGREITEKLARELTASGFNIVSGLADGVDTISHKGCLKEGGKTIAVVAGGLEYIYPALNKKLSEEIAKSGLIVTEKPPKYKAQTYDFPIRNRIIAGLAKGVLITEAGLKSGTMHTKDYAIEYGKELFVVPGNITNEQSEGCNHILKQLPSNMVLSVNDILDAFNKPKYKVVPKNVQLNLDEAMIFNLLKNGELTFDEILLKTQLDGNSLLKTLTLLSFRGIIKKLAGNTYSL